MHRRTTKAWNLVESMIHNGQNRRGCFARDVHQRRHLHQWCDFAGKNRCLADRAMFVDDQDRLIRGAPPISFHAMVEPGSWHGPLQDHCEHEPRHQVPASPAVHAREDTCTTTISAVIPPPILNLPRRRNHAAHHFPLRTAFGDAKGFACPTCRASFHHGQRPLFVLGHHLPQTG